MLSLEAVNIDLSRIGVCAVQSSYAQHRANIRPVAGRSAVPVSSSDVRAGPESRRSRMSSVRPPAVGPQVARQHPQRDCLRVVPGSHVLNVGVVAHLLIHAHSIGACASDSVRSIRYFWPGPRPVRSAHIQHTSGGVAISLQHISL